MRYLNKFEIFTEALKPSVFRRYVKEFNKERYDKLFKMYKEKYDGDRNDYRIYLPLITDDKKPKIGKVEKEITEILNENDYEMVNYISGHCKFKTAKNPSRIGQVLTKLATDAEKEGNNTTKYVIDKLMKSFVEDPLRKVGAESDLLVCISRHPYDIAGSDTDRAWTNCMTIPHDRAGSEDRYMKLKRLRREKEMLELRIAEIDEYTGYDDETEDQEEEALKYFGMTEKELSDLRHRFDKVEDEISELENNDDEDDREERGCNTQYLICDVKEGSLISYLIKKTDKNLKNPLACLNIKPYINEEDPNDFILVSDKNSYGDRDTEGFKKTVDAWLDEVNKGKEGIFNLNKRLYDDSDYGPIFKMNPNKIQDKVDACKSLHELSDLLSKLGTDLSKIKLNNIEKIVENDTLENLITYRNTLRNVGGINYQNLIKMKLESCDIDKLSYNTYDRIYDIFSDLRAYLRTKKFKKYYDTRKFLNMVNNPTSRFLSEIDENPEYKSIISFSKLIEGEKNSIGSYEFKIERSFPQSVKNLIGRSIFGYKYLLVLAIDDNQRAFRFYINNDSDIKLAKKLFPDEEKIIAKKVRKPAAKVAGKQVRKPRAKKA